MKYNIYLKCVLLVFIISSCRTAPYEAENALSGRPIAGGEVAGRPAGSTVMPGEAVDETAISVAAPGRLAAMPIGEIVAALYQETVYSGVPQPIMVRASPENAFPVIIIYYLSRDNLLNRLGGTAESPALPGIYYVHVDVPPLYGYVTGSDVVVVYHIKRAPVLIIADPVQYAAFNGDPQRITASAEPYVTLNFSYFPTSELRQIAMDALLNPGAVTEASLSRALSPFRRVPIAPSNQGTYFVLVHFPGDDLFEPAMKEVTFIIGPPIGRN